MRKRLADGTIKEYHYGPHTQRAARFGHDTVGALIQSYKASPEWLRLSERSREMYAIYFRSLEADPHTIVKQITRRDVLALRDAIATTRGPGAATGFVRASSVLFGWAVDREWIDVAPTFRVKVIPGGHLPAWTAGDVAIALKRLSEPLRRAVVLALHTGQRRGDLVTMTWSDYDGKSIRVQQEKTGARLVIPAHADLRAEIDRWEHAADTILTGPDGLPWVPQRLTERLKRALEKLDGLTPSLGIHGLRKLAAARLADAGCSTHEIAAITGHRTLTMVALYTASADQKRLATAAMHRLKPRHTTIRQNTRKALK